MHKINLRELYPDMYKTDTFLEVTDEVQAVFLSDKRAEAAHERQMYRYKAQYSLDCNNGIEDAVVHRSPTPEEVLEDKQLRDQIFTAVMELPDKQAKRIYARFYLDMSVKEIAQVEGVDPRRVRTVSGLFLPQIKKGATTHDEEENAADHRGMQRRAGTHAEENPAV